MAEAHVREFLKDVIGVVEVTSYESHSLWHDYCYKPIYGQPPVTWEQGGSGYLWTVGYIGKRPICISVFVNTINGHRILFLEATSQLVDWKMIKEWLTDNLPMSAFKDGGKYVNIVDARNFTHLIPSPADQY